MSSDAPSRDQVTRLLRDCQAGDASAVDEILPLLYADLRRMASRMMADERVGHSLQPTALVHEAYVRLVESESCTWRDRAHFVALATRVMRQVLVDHARAKGRHKRGGGDVKISLSSDALPIVATGADALDVLVLDDSLSRLEAEHHRAARVVEERVFGGLTVDEIASLHDVSRSTVEADWRFARAWLTRHLRDQRT